MGGGPAGRRFLLVTLGCFRNEVESDILRSALGALGLAETAALDEADVILVNSCGFIRASCEEGIDTILELAEQASRRDARLPVIVLGCMGQRYGDDLLSAMPEIGAVLGAGWEGDLADALSAVMAGERYAGGLARGPAAVRNEPVRTFDSSDTATLFVRVADGCDRACAFCTIPSIRGSYRSRPLAEITDEVGRLAGDREREVVLVAQDLTSYGCDLEEGTGLTRLIEAVASLEQVRWLRLLYLQPEGVTHELIDAVAANPKVCDYFDIPFQHASGRMLKAMGRPGDAALYLALVDSIRERCPEAALRTTVMVGYPGETEDDFRRLLFFVGEARFDWLGAFIYSPEEGTRAAGLRGRVPEDTARERYGRILELQDSIEASKLERFAGRRFEVVVDGAAGIEGYDLVGRSYREAPVVDGVIYLEPTERRRAGGHEAGEFVWATITGQEGLDLVGEIRTTD